MKHYLYLPLACLISVVIFSGCNPKKIHIDNNEYKNVSINPDFITNPPIPESTGITRLENTDGGNMLFEAVISKEKVKSNMLAVMITDEDKVVLHDDGKNGDKVADDGVYSLVFAEDEEHFTAYLEGQKENFSLAKREKKPLTRFKGRFASAVAFNDCTLTPVQGKIDFTKRISLVDFAHLPLFFPVSETLKHNSLMVTDPQVVNDPGRTFSPCTPGSGTPGGAWTFGHLITEMANQPLTGVTPENFLMNFLQTWLTVHTVNGDAIAARVSINNIISDWTTLSGGAGSLDVNKAPFKLLAIVNRFDLRTSSGYGGGNAGEGRFVFCATTRTCVAKPFLVIFEYGVNIKKCEAIHDYAQQWKNLESIPIGTPAYNAALQVITDQFALRNTNPSKPNKSSLNQIRTNEIALSSPWELREFNISATTHLLENVTTKREPQIPFNSQGSSPDVSKVVAFGKFVNDHEALAIADKLNIPLVLSVGGTDVPFLGGKAHTLNPTTFHWDGQVSPPGAGFITNDEARMHISLNTCSGCHGGETNTGNFTHVGLPISPTTGARLSPFLTGNPPFSGSDWLVSDRAHRPDGIAPPDDIQWPFNDLERRGRDLIDFLATSCPKKFPLPRLEPKERRTVPPISIELTRILTFDPMMMTH